MVADRCVSCGTEGLTTLRKARCSKCGGAFRLERIEARTRLGFRSVLNGAVALSVALWGMYTLGRGPSLTALFAITAGVGALPLIVKLARRFQVLHLRCDPCNRAVEVER